MPNPFTYGGVVGPDVFCNRTQELQDLARAMENGDRLFLYSERRMGKTSLLRRALDRLPRDRYVAAYVDLWPTDGQQSFAEGLAQALAQAFSTTAERLLDTARSFFSRLAPALTLDDEGRPQLTFGARHPADVSLREVLAVPADMAARSGRRVVVVLDEFQQILQYGSDRAERILRAAVQEPTGVAYVFCGSRKHLIQGMFLDEERPLYRSATHYPLGPIDAEAWIPFVESRFRAGDRRIDPERIRALCGLTEGHPFYTQHLCHALWELCEPGERVDEGLAARALDLLLQREHHAYSVLWETLTLNQRRLVAGLVAQGRDARPFSADFVHGHGLGSASSAQRAARSMLERDIIDRDADGYVVTDRFLRLWIRRTLSR